MRVLGVAIVLALAGLPASIPAASPAGSTSALVPPLHYTERTIANGLHVIAMSDRRTANVAVHVWYKVGSKFDPKGRSGFAHLFEHLMFKATRNMVSEQLDRMTEDVGGYDNARTTEDFTSYYEVVPAHHLQRILWAEAERMGSLVIDDAVFKSERDVVKEELRQLVLAPAYGRLAAWYVVETAFTKHPYGRPGIGSMEDLDAATVEDVRAFHATYYRPDNAVLVVSGNFDEAELNAWVDRYFAPLRAPAGVPLPRITAVEPRWTSARSYDTYQANVPLPAVAITYQAPPVSSPDMPAMIVIDSLLNKGDSARLTQVLQYDKKIATGAGTSFFPSSDPGIFTIIAVLAKGRSVAEGEQALRDEATRLRDVPVDAGEMAKAKNQLMAEILKGRETADGRAGEIAKATILYGSAARADGLLRDIQGVTAADIQRVAARYLRDDANIVIRYQDESARPKGATIAPISLSPDIETVPVTIASSKVPVVTLAPEGQRIAPPPPAPPAASTPIAIAERRLPNGMRVIVAPRRGAGIVTAQLSVGAGAATDSPARMGLARIVARLTIQGAGARDASEVARQVESYGATLTSDAARDSSSVTLNALSSSLDPAFGLFADAVRRPTFAPSELDRKRQEIIDQLPITMQDPKAVASAAANRLVYGGSSYGSLLDGTKLSLAAMKPEDVTAFYRHWWRPDLATLVISGDIDVPRALALAAKAFSDWHSPAAPRPAPQLQHTNNSAPGRLVLIDIPGSAQPAVAVTRPALARSDANYYPALVANAVLGVGYSSRINQEVRAKRGLSYGATSTLDARRFAGSVLAVALTRNEVVPQVIDLMKSEFSGLATRPPGRPELLARQSSLNGRFDRLVETSRGMAATLSDLVSDGVAPIAVNEMDKKVLAVSAEAVRQAALSYFDLAPATIVVAGDAKSLMPTLNNAYPDMLTVPVDKFGWAEPPNNALLSY